MGSTTISKKSYLISTDLGLVRNDITVVEGYDVEDIVRDKATSQARAIALLNLGKSINPNMPTTSRTVSSTWLNNTEELAQ